MPLLRVSNWFCMKWALIKVLAYQCLWFLSQWCPLICSALGTSPPCSCFQASGALIFCFRPVVLTSFVYGLWCPPLLRQACGVPLLFSALDIPSPVLFLGLRCPPLLLTACCAPHLCFRPVVLPYFVFSPVVLPSSALDPLFRATDFHFVPHPTCRIENWHICLPSSK